MTVAMFAVMNGLVLQPLPYPDAERLVQVWSELQASGLDEADVSYPRYQAYAGSNSFAALGASWKQDFTLGGRGDSVRLPGARVSAGLFKALGMVPLRGRLFADDEDLPGGAAVVIISQALWNSRFASSPETIGSSITIDGTPATVVGVVAGPFVFARECCEIFVPRVFEPDTLSRRAIERGAGYLAVIGRLRPGVAIDDALSEVRSLSRRYREDHRDNTDASFEPRLVPLATQVVGGTRNALLVLLACAALLLATAVANVCALLLIRNEARADDLEIRRMLGAHRLDVAVTHVAEALLLAVASLGLAQLVATLVLGFAQRSYAALLPHWNVSVTEGNVVLAATATAGTVGLVIGLTHALSAGPRMPSRISTGLRVRGGSPASGTARRYGTLAAGQLALSFTLLSAATTLSLELWSLEGATLGYEPRGVLTAQVSPRADKYPDIESQAYFLKRLRDRLRQLPGVVDAGTSLALPGVSDQRIPYRIGGRPAPPPDQLPMAQFRFVDAGYLAAMAIRVKRGRAFSDLDSRDGSQVAIISESLAKQEFGERDPLGAEITLASTPPRSIVGVFDDVRELGAALPAQPGVYIPLQQMFVPRLPPMYIVVRSQVWSTSLSDSVRRAALSVDPDQPLARVRPLSGIVNDGLAVQRLRAVLATLFAGAGVFLAGIGVHCAISQTVISRQSEFGIRLALGATPSALAVAMARRTLALLVLGLAGGVILLSGLNQGLGLLIGGPVQGRPVSLWVAGAILAIAAGLATVGPALRILRINPADALRAPGS